MVSITFSNTSLICNLLVLHKLNVIIKQFPFANTLIESVKKAHAVLIFEKFRKEIKILVEIVLSLPQEPLEQLNVLSFLRIDVLHQ